MSPVQNKLIGAQPLTPERGEEIAGHLVIAHESLKHGWWEAIVIEAKNGSFRLQYRDFCNLPKFVRDRSGIGARGSCRAIACVALDRFSRNLAMSCRS
jgi:hypothetical protein